MISIIIPVYNEEKEIESTVRQFAALRIPHEVIVADTKSTDQTVAIAKHAGATVVMLPADVERGVARGRNNGVHTSKGEFLVSLDNGTIIPDPNAFFAKALARFEKDPKLVLLSVKIKVDPHVATFSDNAVSWLMNACFALMDNLLNAGLASGKFIMMRREAFQRSGGFNETLSTAEDIELSGRLAKLGHVRIAWNLAVFHSGRRFHQQGAWRTLYRWIKNAFAFWIFKKGSRDVWEPIR
jgi:GT2 family glycosyltransferase